MNRLFKAALYPFAVLYNGLTAARNFLYDQEFSKSERFEVPLIAVGNLRVGGTGKTPHVEYLIRLLKDKKKVATLSRGYGRRSKGFILADESVNASSIGDEPMQFYLKYGKDIAVAVGEKRVPAIKALLRLPQGIDTIILDDAFQHRPVRPHLNILLSDYNHPFYQDLLMPAGRLREARSGAHRADVVIITKCPAALSLNERAEIQKEVLAYTRSDVPVFFTTVRYMEPQPLMQHAKPLSKNVILFSGLANPALLKDYVRSRFNLLHSLDFKDHHVYTAADILQIRKIYERYAAEGVSILVTEKDMVKLLQQELRAALQGLPLFFLPIEIAFLGEQEKFDQIIFDCIG